MWARKRIEIKARDLIAGLGDCVLPRSHPQSKSAIAAAFNSNQTFTCLSVRSGFDLLLQTVDWLPGSQIIFSGLTIRDMPRIAREHNLVPVGTDVDWKTLAPSVEDIQSRITPQTRAIVIAHLMGGRCKLEQIADLARHHNLMLIEDCAQTYVGNHYSGSVLADVSMFSFGSIKTNTALGGAVLFVRDPLLREKLEANHALWRSQTNRAYLKRILKYTFVKLISTWPVAASIRLGFRAIGSNHDAMAAGMAKGFAGDDFFRRIRQQPSTALLSQLARRIHRFDPTRIENRKRRGQQLTQFISRGNKNLFPIGCQAIDPTHWVFAVMVEQPDRVVRELWNLGFDATSHSSLQPVIDDPLESDQVLPEARRILEHLVFLPLDLPMPVREIERLGTAVGAIADPLTPWPIDTKTNQAVDSNPATNPASR